MLTAEDNERLTRVGPGTPMGDLLRHYWQPIAPSSEFTDEYRIKPVRLLGEDLVLYRDLAGTWGLIERWCAHRGTDLSMGRVETAASAACATAGSTWRTASASICRWRKSRSRLTSR